MMALYLQWLCYQLQGFIRLNSNVGFLEHNLTTEMDPAVIDDECWRVGGEHLDFSTLYFLKWLTTTFGESIQCGL
jgi:hypothetical protein